MELPSSIFATCALGAVLVFASVTDARARIVPNGCIVAGTVIWVISLCTEWMCGTSIPVLIGQVLWSFAGAFGVGVLLLATSLVFEKLTGKLGLGGGDIKLFFVTGLFLGFEGNALNLLLACAFGVPFGWWWKRRICRKALALDGSALSVSPIAVAEGDGFPFAPCIALSTTICLCIM